MNERPVGTQVLANSGRADDPSRHRGIRTGADSAGGDALAKRIVALAGKSKGVCLVPRGGELTFAMAEASEFLVVGQETDAKAAQAAREKADKAGLLGRRLYVAEAKPGSTSWRQLRQPARHRRRDGRPAGAADAGADAEGADPARRASYRGLGKGRERDAHESETRSVGQGLRRAGGICEDRRGRIGPVGDGHEAATPGRGRMDASPVRCRWQPRHARHSLLLADHDPVVWEAFNCGGR